MLGNDKRMYTTLLVGAALAVALLAALTAWTAQLTGGTWLPVLAPFALVLLVPVSMLVWLHTAEDTDELLEAPDGPGRESVLPLGDEPAPRTTRRVA